MEAVRNVIGIPNINIRSPSCPYQQIAYFSERVSRTLSCEFRCGFPILAAFGVDPNLLRTQRKLRRAGR